MNLLTVAQVVERILKVDGRLSEKSARQTVAYHCRTGRLNAYKHGRSWAIYDDEKLQEYISNPPKRGARKKGSNDG
jgi:hypothetical protein